MSRVEQSPYPRPEPPAKVVPSSTQMVGRALMLTGLVAVGAALVLANLFGLFLARMSGLLLLIGYVACFIADARKRKFDVFRLLFFLVSEIVVSITERMLASSVR